MNKTDLTKYPEDEEFVNRILESKKRNEKGKVNPTEDVESIVPTVSNNRFWPEDGSFDMDGGVMLKTSEILDFAEGVDSD